MSSIHIDRLILTAEGLSASQGEGLANRVATALSRAGGVPQWGDVAGVELAVHQPDSTDLDELGNRIAMEIVRQLGATG